MANALPNFLTVEDEEVEVLAVELPCGEGGEPAEMVVDLKRGRLEIPAAVPAAERRQYVARRLVDAGLSFSWPTMPVPTPRVVPLYSTTEFPPYPPLRRVHPFG